MSADILEEIAEYAKKRVERKKTDNAFAFEEVLKGDGISFICECKKASPSKGIIAEDFPYIQIAKEYEAAGASAISVLTEPKWFRGSEEYLREISSAVSIPTLRKDFVVDEYMIYEAKLLGASAVLLICSILEKERLGAYIGLTRELGMSALVEAHNEKEIETALDCEASVIGVNNRNLKDFSVDIDNAKRLRDMVPRDVVFVAESGIQTRSDVEALEQCGVDAVLVGETMMRARDKSKMLATLKGISQ